MSRQPGEPSKSRAQRTERSRAQMSRQPGEPSKSRTQRTERSRAQMSRQPEEQSTENRAQDIGQLSNSKMARSARACTAPSRGETQRTERREQRTERREQSTETRAQGQERSERNTGCWTAETSRDEPSQASEERERSHNV